MRGQVTYPLTDQAKEGYAAIGLLVAAYAGYENYLEMAVAIGSLAPFIVEDNLNEFVSPNLESRETRSLAAKQALFRRLLTQHGDHGLVEQFDRTRQVIAQFNELRDGLAHGEVGVHEHPIPEAAHQIEIHRDRYRENNQVDGFDRYYSIADVMAAARSVEEAAFELVMIGGQVLQRAISPGRGAQ